MIYYMRLMEQTFQLHRNIQRRDLREELDELQSLEIGLSSFGSNPKTTGSTLYDMGSTSPGTR